nr:isochorismatase family protein [Conexibacter arvalis]
MIIDVQHDFLPPAGALAVPEGDRVIDAIVALARSGRFDLVVATRDWHPPDHSSFAGEGGPWPEHCVAESPGAALHERVEQVAEVVIDKGTERAAEGYSAFETPALREVLRERGVDAVTIAGVATDYCVRHTALDALGEGLRVTVATDAVRGIDAERTAETLRELAEAGAVVD